MRKKLMALILTVMAAGVLGTLEARANQFNFGVRTVIPDNQINPQQTFFNLLMEPGADQQLEIVLSNPTDEEVTVEAQLAPATTNQNGVVEYGPRDIERDPTLIHALDEIVTGPDYVVLPPHSSVSLFLEVQMPEEAVEGVIAGGITLMEREVEVEEEENDSTGGGMAIENRFAFVVAIVLRNSEEPVAPALELGDVFADQLNRRNMIRANVQNLTPVFVNQVAIEAEVVDRSSGEVLFEESREGMQMAPNSNMYFPLRLGTQPLTGGAYTMNMRVVSGDNVWDFSRDFDIEDELADNLNATDVILASHVEPRNWTWVYITGGVVLLVATNVATILFLKRKKG